MIPVTPSAADSEPANARHWLVVGAILVAGIAVQTVAILRAEVPGQDAVALVEAARRIDAEGFWTALAAGERHPLFPATVAITYRILVSVVGSQPWLWAASAQIAAGLALVLTVLPLAGLASRLVSRQAAWVACGGLMVLPKVAELGPYGIGDSLHLLLFTTAVWASVAALAAGRTARRAGWWAVAAVATGLALLTRAESVVLVAVTVGFFAGSIVTPRLGTKWRSAAGGLAVYLGCLGLVLGAAVSLTQPGSAREAIEWGLGWGERETANPADGEFRLPEEPPGAFAVKEPGEKLRERGFGPALVQYVLGLGEVFWYVPGGIVVIGLARLWRRATSGDWFCRSLFVVFSLVAIAYAAGVGYLRPRHLAPLVVLALPCVLPGLEWGMSQLRRLRPRGRGRETSVALLPQGVTTSGTAVLHPLGWFAVVIMAGVCLPWVVHPLQLRQAGYREAADWLSEQPESGGVVLDTRGWTGLYSGRPTLTYRNARRAFADPGLRFLVVSRGELQTSSTRATVLRRLIGSHGRLVAQFPQCPQTTERSESVLIFAWRPWEPSVHRRHSRYDGPVGVPICQSFPACPNRAQ